MNENWSPYSRTGATINLCFCSFLVLMGLLAAISGNQDAWGMVVVGIPLIAVFGFIRFGWRPWEGR
jgi:hypothetical protein